jgi:hypothetical protein
MDGSRFDAWTRRQFGLTLGGGLALLLGLSKLDEIEAKKKRKRKRKNRKKKRCKKVEQDCQGEFDQSNCCNGLSCEPLTPGSEDNRCCHPFVDDPCDGGGCCDILECRGGTCQFPPQ